MLIELERRDKSTLGKLFIDGVGFCDTLEDEDRGLTSEMLIDEIKAIKVHSQTAIPKGRYEVVLSYSNRFKKLLPLLVSVKGFEGIRIHSGNTQYHTEGCILLGTASKGMVINSRSAMSKFMAVFTKAIKTEKVFINII